MDLGFRGSSKYCCARFLEFGWKSRSNKKLLDPRTNAVVWSGRRLYGEEQYRRCIRSYELIKKHGYVPEKFFDGYISGFFIKRDDDYRFCVTSGKHRIGALSVLGEDRIKIRTDSDLKILDLSSLEKYQLFLVD